MTGERSARYWRARAEALEAANRRLHERLARLLAALPPEFAGLLDGDGQTPRYAPAVLEPEEESPRPTPSSVEPDLARLWNRTAPPRGD